MKISAKNLLLAGVATVVWLYWSKQPAYSGAKLKRSVVIDRSPAELYTFWRNFENLPRIAEILESVQMLDAGRSRWTAAAPGGLHVRWDAEITKDIVNEMIGWRSLPGSLVETAGYVRFEPVRGGRSTRVRLALEYDLPAGKVGALLASLFGKRPEAHIEALLRRFKQVMEDDAAAPAENGQAQD